MSAEKSTAPSTAVLALQALGKRLAEQIAFDALSVCVLDDSQEKLLLLPLTGEESRRGTLKKILSVGEQPFPTGLEERVLERPGELPEGVPTRRGNAASPVPAGAGPPVRSTGKKEPDTDGRSPEVGAPTGTSYHLNQSDGPATGPDGSGTEERPEAGPARAATGEEQDSVPAFWGWFWDPPVRHGLIVPVHVFGRVVATFNFGRVTGPFTVADIDTARRAAKMMVEEVAQIALHQKMELSESTARQAYQRLIEFSRVGNLIVQEKDLDRVCSLFMQALREHSVFRRGILTLLDEDLRGYKWFFFGMSDEEIEYFHSHASNKMEREQRAKIFQQKYRVGNSYYIPSSSHWEYTGVRSRCSEDDMLDWHPDEFLFIPLHGSHKRMVGIVSVDDPSDGRAPTAEGLSSLELFANQVAHAIEEKKLGQEVKKSTLHYKTLIDTMNDGLVVMDLAERITMVNPTLSRLVDYRLEEMIGSSLFTFLSSESREIVMTKRDERRLGIKSRYEVELVSKDGTIIPVLMSGAPLYESNRLIGSFAVISDLREQKKSETEFRKMHEEIVDANKKLQDSMDQLRNTQEKLVQAGKLSAVGELVSGVAHELNNPLTGVLGYSQLLIAKNVPDGIKQQLGTIHREATRCQKIVQNLLTFARKHKSEKAYVDVNEIVVATVELRAYQLRVDNVELETDLHPDLPRTMADYHQLQQVFINLITNAHQAMVGENGRGRLVIRSRAENDSIVVTFEDDGPGIPEERLGKIFDPFFTTKEVGKGTGLGLSLSYGIVREHGGSISAGGRADGRPGSTFRVELPVWEEEQRQEKARSLPVAVATSGKRILVVDDEETVLELLSDLLSSRGHVVEVAGDGRVALDTIRESTDPFDLIISDLRMPKMDGRALYEAVSEIAPDLARRMIFATGDTVIDDLRDFFEEKGNAFISKPFALDELEQIIASLFEVVEAGP